MSTVRDVLQPCYNLLTWHSIDASLRSAQFEKAPRLVKGWKKLNKKLNALDETQKVRFVVRAKCGLNWYMMHDV